ncbi:MAG: hypothetical protein M5U14_05245 [Acidimicrobiia bacterium]|nr:hypothetical protein [Acidimicrobiia bacterium]
MPAARAQDTDHATTTHMTGHVLGRIGLQIRIEDGSPRIDLPLHPILLDADGHLDFGVLGLYLDAASGQAPSFPQNRPWLHADITAHRLNAPEGQVLSASSRVERLGGRSGVLVVDVHDDLGVHVARSVQQFVFVGPPRPAERTAHERARFYRRLHGTCSLRVPLHEALEIGRDGDGDGRAGWSIPLQELSRNTWGGLHGGVAIALVDAAVTGAVTEATGAPARTVSAAVRYLTPSLAGPVRAEPTIVGRRGDVVLVATEVRDAGAEGTLTILADAHVSVG